MSEVLHPRNIVYTYAIPEEETSVPGAVVLRLRDGAYIIGASDAAIQVAQAHKILEGMEIHHPRQISVIIAPTYSTGWEDDADPQPWVAEDVLRRFGILERARGSKYGALNPNNNGVMADLREPVHVAYNQAIRGEWLLNYPLVLAFSYAAELKHEWSHVRQYREGLPSYSTWSERHAMAEESRALLRLLHRFSRLKAFPASLVQFDANYLQLKIAEYLNGTGFSGHLIPEYIEGTPLKEHSLYRE